jgi:hypothetical protein
VLQVVDQKVLDNVESGYNQKRQADATYKGLKIRIGTDIAYETIAGKDTRAIAHEIGHTAGLKHPVEDNKNSLNPKNMGNNIMSTTAFVTNLGLYSPNEARKIEAGQVMQMWNNRNSINKSSPIKYQI